MRDEIMQYLCGALETCALGLLAHSVRLLCFLTDFTIPEIAISILRVQPCVKSSDLQLKGVTSVVG